MLKVGKRFLLFQLFIIICLQIKDCQLFAGLDLLDTAGCVAPEVWGVWGRAASTSSSDVKWGIRSTDYIRFGVNQLDTRRHKKQKHQQHRKQNQKHKNSHLLNIFIWVITIMIHWICTITLECLKSQDKFCQTD